MTWYAAAHLGIWLAQAPPAGGAADQASNGPVVIVLLAAFTLAGTGITAVAPTLLEIVKNRGKKGTPATTPAATPAEGDPIPDKPKPASIEMVQSASTGLSMVESMVLDYRTQRDNAQRRADEALDELNEAREIIREQAVVIARLEGNRRRTSYYGSTYADTSPDSWDKR